MKKDKVSVQSVVDAMSFEQLTKSCKSCYQYDRCLNLFNKNCGVLKSKIESEMKNMPNIEIVEYDSDDDGDENLVPEEYESVFDKKDVGKRLMNISKLFGQLRNEFRELALNFVSDVDEDDDDWV